MHALRYVLAVVVWIALSVKKKIIIPLNIITLSKLDNRMYANKLCLYM